MRTVGDYEVEAAARETVTAHPELLARGGASDANALLDVIASEHPEVTYQPAFALARYIQYVGFIPFLGEFYGAYYGTGIWDSIQSALHISWPFLLAAIAWPAWMKYRKYANWSLITGMILYVVIVMIGIVIIALIDGSPIF